MRITLAQLMKLVIFSAVACACVVPALEFRGTVGMPALGIFIYELAVVPLAWAVLSFFLVREGPRKDALISALVLMSVGVTLVSLVVAVCVVLLSPSVGARTRGLRFGWVPFAAVILLLAGSFRFLLKKLLRQLQRSTKSN